MIVTFLFFNRSWLVGYLNKVYLNDSGWISGLSHSSTEVKIGDHSLV